MALRDIVHIDEDLCDGCGECVPGCAEGAIRIVDGKARLLADNLCDGLGVCLGHCPQGAITVDRREAEAYDEEAVQRHLAGDASPPAPLPLADAPAPAPARPPGGGCPGAAPRAFDAPAAAPADPARAPGPATALRQWPVQLHLLPPQAPFLAGADLLLAADCAPFAMPDFHARLLAGKALAIACPKLDQAREPYLRKLVAMIDEAGIDTLSVAIMEVPCCGGLLALAREAVDRARRKVPVKRIVVGVRGEILAEEWC